MHCITCTTSNENTRRVDSGDLWTTYKHSPEGIRIWIHHRNEHFMLPGKSICFHSLPLLIKTLSQRSDSSHCQSQTGASPPRKAVSRSCLHYIQVSSTCSCTCVCWFNSFLRTVLQWSRFKHHMSSNMKMFRILVNGNNRIMFIAQLLCWKLGLWLTAFYPQNNSGETFHFPARHQNSEDLGTCHHTEEETAESEFKSGSLFNLRAVFLTPLGWPWKIYLWSSCLCFCK